MALDVLLRRTADDLHSSLDRRCCGGCACLLLPASTARAAEGALDSSFGDGGKVETTIGGHDDIGYAVAVQPDGKIVVAGVSKASGDLTADDYDIAVTRYLSDGALDPTSARVAVRAKRLAVVVTRSPECGLIKIYWRDQLAREITLTAPVTSKRQVVNVASFSLEAAR